MSVINRLKCFLGIHVWGKVQSQEYDCGNHKEFEVWRNCKRCGEKKVVHSRHPIPKLRFGLKTVTPEDVGD